MLNDHLRSMIYDKYIRPTEKRSETYAGVEIELPIINLSGEATDHSVSRNAMNAAVRHFSFQPFRYDDDGFLHEAQDPVSGDLFSFFVSVILFSMYTIRYEKFRNDGCFYAARTQGAPEGRVREIK